ncbi:hypothetical protein IFM89_014551 [Coptis chinensis]|uniref:Uncharacterized protein n=1 Tax=Coptis chinensis TaxID=261450 RepID=A0A835H362_9MAGN|nr:hypothetical protein IFM89_014551 [Coptis chinensis]
MRIRDIKAHYNPQIIDMMINGGDEDIAAEAVKIRRRATKKPYSRSIVGATLEVIQKKRTEKTEAPDATREAALWQRMKKKAKKAKVMAKSQKTQSKVPKGGAASKGPKLGGGDGKPASSI